MNYFLSGGWLTHRQRAVSGEFVNLESQVHSAHSYTSMCMWWCVCLCIYVLHTRCFKERNLVYLGVVWHWLACNFSRIKLDSPPHWTLINLKTAFPSVDHLSANSFGRSHASPFSRSTNRSSLPHCKNPWYILCSHFTWAGSVFLV